ncbi:MAG: FG-GAP-like repeat-containing protein [Acidobacteriota bacterium]
MTLAPQAARAKPSGWLWALALCCTASVAWPQAKPDDPRTVEMVLAQSENQAQVVARAMWTGFFIDQLRIPATQYLGKVPWAKLGAGIRQALQEAKPGEPQVLTNPQGQHLVAMVLPTGPPALLGDEAYARDAEEIQAILAVGPTETTLLTLEVDVDTSDLQAICRSKRRLIEADLERVQAAVTSLPATAPVDQLIHHHSEAISTLSLEGQLDEAIATVEALVAKLPPAPPDAERSHVDVMHQVLGILELRRGEVDNCLNSHPEGGHTQARPEGGHTQARPEEAHTQARPEGGHTHVRHREMCLFPLSAAARHRLDDGARRALTHFSRYLERHPDDLEVRWLLNIAAMTLGKHPDGVPERFRIGTEAFASPVDPGRFWDVAGPAGVAYSDNAGGSVTDDFDGDGLLDIVTSSRDPCEPLRLYLNRGGGADGVVTFEDITTAAGLESQLGGLNVTQVDFDNDGRRDLYVMRGGWETAIRDSLLRNRESPSGGVIFEDVTDRAGLGGPAHRTHSATWADYDGDGWLDLFVGHEMSFSQLFRSRGVDADGVVTFEDVTAAAGLRFRSLTKGAAWGDVEGDGRPDLYVSNFGDRNLLFVNRGDGTFDEVARERGVAEPTYSFPTWFWDYDNDGHQDLFVATLLQTVDDVAREYLGKAPRGETLRVYRGRGDGSFEDTTESLGLARMIPTMGANFGDLDNDGYLDVYLGTGAPPYGMLIPNRLFLNQSGRAFVDVTTATGTGHLQKGHGVAFADLDNDGDQDIFSNMGGAFPGDKYPSALFENPGHGNDWIALELIGTRSNRTAIGARLRVVLESGGRQTQRVRWVTSGGSFGASPLAQHIGLGPDAKILRIEIDWPAGPAKPSDAANPTTDSPRQVLRDVPINTYLVVTEGTPGFRLAPRPRFTLGSSSESGTVPHHHH